MLLVDDRTKIPEIYHRHTDKGTHYITGSFGEQELLFNMQSWQQNAYCRYMIASPVCGQIILTYFMLFASNQLMLRVVDLTPVG